MTFKELQTAIFGDPQTVTSLYKDKPSVTTTYQTQPNILQRIASKVTGKPFVPNPAPQQGVSGFADVQRAVSSPPPVVPQQAPVVQPQVPTGLDLNTVQKMINVYGGEKAPLHNYAGNLAGAGKYDFWKNNPELLALIPHLETSSGRYITRPNNLTNWGINYPGNNEAFSKMTPEQVLDLWISGIGERSGIYAPFRTGAPLTDEELLKFAQTYEPANGDYGPNLINGRKHIRQTLGF